MLRLQSHINGEKVWNQTGAVSFPMLKILKHFISWVFRWFSLRISDRSFCKTNWEKFTYKLEGHVVSCGGSVAWNVNSIVYATNQWSWIILFGSVTYWKNVYRFPCAILSIEWSGYSYFNRFSVFFLCNMVRGLFFLPLTDSWFFSR